VILRSADKSDLCADTCGAHLTADETAGLRELLLERSISRGCATCALEDDTACTPAAIGCVCTEADSATSTDVARSFRFLI